MTELKIRHMNYCVNAKNYKLTVFRKLPAMAMVLQKKLVLAYATETGVSFSPREAAALFASGSVFSCLSTQCSPVCLSVC